MFCHEVVKNHNVFVRQRHYIRILWMVPIYSIESWLALRFNEQKLYLETMREAYEAYVVYSFFKLMREFFGPKDVSIFLSFSPVLTHFSRCL
jgi:hypothetical protein